MKAFARRCWQAWCPSQSPLGEAQSRASRVAEAMLGIGVFWSLAGVLLTPTMKLYYNLVLLFIYLPALWLTIARRVELGRLIRGRPELWLFFLLFAWANLSLFWASGEFERLSRVKQATLFVLLVCGWLLWARRSPGRLRATLQAVGLVNTVYALAALFYAPTYDATRLSGFGGFLDNPNAAGYASAFFLLMMLPLAPQGRWARLVWLLLQLPPLLYVALCGCRGALLGLLVTALFCLILLPGWRGRLLALAMLCGGVGLVHFEPNLLARGDSERLELLRSAWPLLREHLWIGVGLGTDYQIEGWSGSFHGSAHNFPLHTAIQYGVPALLAWLALWALLGWRAWRCRGSQLGLALLLLWVFSSVALQFDVFSLWERTRAMWLMPWVVFLLGLSLEPVAARLSRR